MAGNHSARDSIAKSIPRQMGIRVSASAAVNLPHCDAVLLPLNDQQGPAGNRVQAQTNRIAKVKYPRD
jgi:hypothetical protein